MPDRITLLAALYATASIITFAAFALDKRAAVLGRRRVRESTLHTLEVFGGWPGALLAIPTLRHKNRKLTYLAALSVIVILHGAGWWLMWR